jgi:hypothetical protein
MFLFDNEAQRHAEKLIHLLTLSRVVALGISVGDLITYCRLHRLEAGNFDGPDDSFPVCSILPQVSLTYTPDTKNKSSVESLQIMGFDELRGLSILILRQGSSFVILERNDRFVDLDLSLDREAGNRLRADGRPTPPIRSGDRIPGRFVLTHQASIIARSVVSSL